MKYDRIDPYNRYGEETYLKHKEGSKYLFVSKSPYIRCGMIERSGGPFLAVGGTLPVLKPDGIVEKFVILSIYYDGGYIIELKDDISCNKTKTTVRKQSIQSYRCGRVPKTS